MSVGLRDFPKKSLSSYVEFGNRNVFHAQCKPGYHYLRTKFEPLTKLWRMCVIKKITPTKPRRNRHSKGIELSRLRKINVDPSHCISCSIRAESWGRSVRAAWHLHGSDFPFSLLQNIASSDVQNWHRRHRCCCRFVILLEFCGFQFTYGSKHVLRHSQQFRQRLSSRMSLCLRLKMHNLLWHKGWLKVTSYWQWLAKKENFTPISGTDWLINKLSTHEEKQFLR